MGFRDKLPKDVKRTKRSGREYIDELNTNGRFFRHILSERRWQDGLLKSLDPAIDEYGQRRKPLPPPEDGDDEDSDVEEVERLDSRWQERYSLKERSGLTWDRDVSSLSLLHNFARDPKRLRTGSTERSWLPRREQARHCPRLSSCLLPDLVHRRRFPRLSSLPSSLRMDAELARLPAVRHG